MDSKHAAVSRRLQGVGDASIRIGRGIINDCVPADEAVLGNRSRNASAREHRRTRVNNNGLSITQ